MEAKSSGSAAMTSEGNNLPKSPYVSVIVPVYNMEKQVGRCLESLVHQTLEEIEIIVVNDGSTDSSQAVIDEYAAHYAPKVIPVKKENGGLSSARKYGLGFARAPYVCFVDSDDYVSYRLCELTLNKAMENDADLVYFPNQKTYASANTYEINGTVPGSASQEDLIIYALASFCCSLMKSSFLRAHDPFLNMWYEDAATMPALMSRAQNVGIITVPLYAYTQDIDESITSKKMDHRTLDFLRADQIVWERCSNKYKRAMAIRLARRIVWELHNLTIYYDRVVEHAKAMRDVLLPYLEQDPEQLSPSVWSTLRDAWGMPEPWLPLKIYLDGFSVTTDRPNYLRRVKGAFWNGMEAVWLDEATCVLDDAPAFVQLAYRQGDMASVAAYFAAKSIYREGGIYVAQNIRLTSTLNSLRFDQAFFGFLNKDEFTDRIFGGRSGHPVFAQLLKIFETESIQGKLAERIGLVLVGFGGVHLNGKEFTGIDGLHIYPLSMFVIPVAGMENVCRHDFSEELASGSILCIPEKIFNEIDRLHSVPCDVERQAHEKTKKMLESTKEAFRRQTEAYEKIKKSNRSLKKAVGRYEHSLSWKITKPLRWLKHGRQK